MDLIADTVLRLPDGRRIAEGGSFTTTKAY